MTDRPRFGCIEAGGTKFMLGIADAPDNFLATTRIPTTTPEETIGAVIDWFAGQDAVAAIGIASFGPVDPDPASPHWGFITETTKLGWSQTDFAQYSHLIPQDDALMRRAHIGTIFAMQATNQFYFTSCIGGTRRLPVCCG